MFMTIIPSYDVVVTHEGKHGEPDFGILWHVSEDDLQAFINVLTRNRVKEICIRVHNPYPRQIAEPKREDLDD